MNTDILICEDVENLPELSVESAFSFVGKELADFLAQKGILIPTEVQAQAIPLAVEGRDVMAQSHTGSGKTLAFGIPIALAQQGKKTSSRSPAALIMTPTRELAQQVITVFETLLSPLRPRCLAITGGASYTRQLSALSRGVNIVVGTPGRICDLMEKKELLLENVQTYVLDEVDQMLDIGFAEELAKIEAALPKQRQTLLFSATLSSEVKAMARKLLNNPVEVKVQHSNASPESIIHGYTEVMRGAQAKALVNMLVFHQPEQGLIFCETRQECADFADVLIARGFNAAPLHGDLSQQERNNVMEKFRDKRLRYLVATNVAARGIDIQDLPLVVNIHVPYHMESYTHRVGRTGRAGKGGTAWTFVTPENRRAFERLVKVGKFKPEVIPVPTAAEVLHKAAEYQLQSLRATTDGATRKTATKAAARVLGALTEQEKDTLLESLIVKNLEKLSVHYADDIVPKKKTDLFAPAPERSFSKPRPWRSFDDRGSARETRFPGKKSFSSSASSSSSGSGSSSRTTTTPRKVESRNPGRKTASAS